MKFLQLFRTQLGGVHVPILIYGKVDVVDENFVNADLDSAPQILDCVRAEASKELGGLILVGFVLDHDDIADSVHEGLLVEGGTENGACFGTALKHLIIYFIMMFM